MAHHARQDAGRRRAGDTEPAPGAVRAGSQPPRSGRVSVLFFILLAQSLWAVKEFLAKHQLSRPQGMAVTAGPEDT